MTRLPKLENVPQMQVTVQNKESRKKTFLTANCILLNLFECNQM